MREQLVAKDDRVLHRELGARADREVGRVDGIAHQHDVAGVPRAEAHRREVAPDRAVLDEAVTAELLREDVAQDRDRAVLVRLVETGGAPGVLAALDDERRAGLLVAIGMDAEQPEARLLEDERERAVRHGAAEPHELVRPHVDVGLQLGGERLAHPAADAVAADDDVRLDLRERLDLVLEFDADAEISGARLQDLEQRLALETAEAVAGRAEDFTAGVDLDVVPAGELRRDLRVGLGIGRGEVAERRVAEHDAEPERVVGTVAFVHDDVVLGRAALDEDAEVEPGRAAADTGDLHGTTLADSRAVTWWCEASQAPSGGGTGRGRTGRGRGPW